MHMISHFRSLKKNMYTCSKLLVFFVSFLQFIRLILKALSQSFFRLFISLALSVARSKKVFAARKVRAREVTSMLDLDRGIEEQKEENRSAINETCSRARWNHIICMNAKVPMGSGVQRLWGSLNFNVSLLHGLLSVMLPEILDSGVILHGGLRSNFLVRAEQY